MSTMTLVAVNRIGLGKPSKDGSITYAEPGQEFDIDTATGESLLEQGAARKPEKKSTPKKATPNKESASSKTEDDTEKQRQELLEKAKAAGIKGLKKNSTIETIQKKLDEAEPVEDILGDGDGDDDDGDDDGDN